MSTYVRVEMRLVVNYERLTPSHLGVICKSVSGVFYCKKNTTLMNSLGQTFKEGGLRLAHKL